MNAEERTHWILQRLYGAKGFLQGLSEGEHPEYLLGLNEVIEYFESSRDTQTQRTIRRWHKLGEKA